MPLLCLGYARKEGTNTLLSFSSEGFKSVMGVHFTLNYGYTSGKSVKINVYTLMKGNSGHSIHQNEGTHSRTVEEWGRSELCNHISQIRIVSRSFSVSPLTQHSIIPLAASLPNHGLLAAQRKGFSHDSHCLWYTTLEIISNFFSLMPKFNC